MTVYVYGFVDAPGRPMRIAQHRVEILSIAGVAVAVERLDAPPAASEAALRTQHAIVERLRRAFEAVLPARFGSFVPIEELRQIIRMRRVELRKALRLVRGRVQMTVRIVTAPAVDAALHAEKTALSGTAYLNARRAALLGPRPPLAAAVSAAVSALVHDERMDADAAHGRTALFHIIDRGDTRRYRASVGRVPVPDGEGVAVTGPYAPFAFAPELWP
jgi:Gas vesicle synthesis protein GvpL/GvpF